MSRKPLKKLEPPSTAKDDEHHWTITTRGRTLGFHLMTQNVRTYYKDSRVFEDINQGGEGGGGGGDSK